METVMLNLNEMKKEELVELAEKLMVENENLKKRSGRKGSGRKLELLEWFGNNGSGKILSIATDLGLSSKNVSSLLSYNKKDGWGIITNEKGEKEITKFNGEVVDSEFILEYVERERALMDKVEE